MTQAKETVMPERLVAGRAPALPRTSRSGWSRTWQYSSPHYFERGADRALCGSPASSNYALTLTDQPDGDIPQSDKTPCAHCTKKLGGLK
ncbi:hypothetical protein [uncultured Deinococcus sp.]|uniref:hypothetical protein n=1 Tax=uncultured Deinococcus sp. TaxID=158789 RepID=UPI00258D56FB|nr:hypothetical protein [uncultured Deinococcus sp.]